MPEKYPSRSRGAGPVIVLLALDVLKFLVAGRTVDGVPARRHERHTAVSASYRNTLGGGYRMIIAHGWSLAAWYQDVANFELQNVPNGAGGFLGFADLLPAAATGQSPPGNLLPPRLPYFRYLFVYLIYLHFLSHLSLRSECLETLGRTGDRYE